MTVKHKHRVADKIAPEALVDSSDVGGALCGAGPRPLQMRVLLQQPPQCCVSSHSPRQGGRRPPEVLGGGEERGRCVCAHCLPPADAHTQRSGFHTVGGRVRGPVQKLRHYVLRLQKAVFDREPMIKFD